MTASDDPTEQSLESSLGSVVDAYVAEIEGRLHSAAASIETLLAELEDGQTVSVEYGLESLRRSLVEGLPRAEAARAIEGAPDDPTDETPLYVDTQPDADGMFRLFFLQSGATVKCGWVYPDARNDVDRKLADLVEVEGLRAELDARTDPELAKRLRLHTRPDRNGWTVCRADDLRAAARLIDREAP